MLRIPRAVLDEVMQHARAAAPDEACGILAGRSVGARHVVQQAIPVRNAHERPRVGYRLDADEQLAALMRIEDEMGLEVVGFYHSHPSGPASFSATDIAEATWPGASHLLVHLAPTVGALSARCDEVARTLVPEPLSVPEGARADP